MPGRRARRGTLHAAPGTLTARAEADDEDSLARTQELVAGRLEKFGRREYLTVTWRRQETSQDGRDHRRSAIATIAGSALDGGSPPISPPVGWRVSENTVAALTREQGRPLPATGRRSGAEGLLRHRRLVDLLDR